MANWRRGEIEAVIGGEQRTLCLTLGALAELEAALGAEDLPALGRRFYGEATANADEAAYEAHRLALGVPGPADWGSEKTYPIEADFDLLGGIDFKKGCFVGQETTSRMKRRGQIKNRMMPLVFETTWASPIASSVAVPE